MLVQMKSKVRPKKQYCEPQVRPITREQVSLVLLGNAWNGDDTAKKVLEHCANILFPSPAKEEVFFKPQPYCSDSVTKNSAIKKNQE
jgi:hypothetical protein